MTEIRTFQAPGIDQRDVARKISSWLKINDFEAQIVDLPDGRITVQARQPKTWRYILGMSSALNITLDKKGDQLVVETGAGSWAEKFAVGAVGVFILHPLLITMAYGVWKQSQLPEKVFEVTEQYIKETRGPAKATRIPVEPAGEPSSDIVPSGMASAAPSNPETAAQEAATSWTSTVEPSTAEPSTAERTPTTTFEEKICASCGQATSKEAKYCDHCGSRLEPGQVEID